MSLLPSKEQWNRWSLPSKISYIGIPLAFFFWILPQPTFLWNWIPTFKTSLVAEIETGSYQIPLGIEAIFLDINKKNDTDLIVKTTDLKSAFEFVVDDDGKLSRLESIAAAQIFYYMNENVPSRLPYEYQILDGYWDVKLENKTEKTLEDVVIILKSTSMVEIRRDNENPEFRFSTEKIEVGKLAPLEELSIYAWTSIDVSKFRSDVKLFHADGIGHVRMYSSLGPFWGFIDRHLWLLMPLGFTCFFIFISIKYPAETGKQ